MFWADSVVPLDSIYYLPVQVGFVVQQTDAMQSSESGNDPEYSSPLPRSGVFSCRKQSLGLVLCNSMHTEAFDSYLCTICTYQIL